MHINTYVIPVPDAWRNSIKARIRIQYKIRILGCVKKFIARSIDKTLTRPLNAVVPDNESGVWNSCDVGRRVEIGSWQDWEMLFRAQKSLVSCRLSNKV